ncbi:hypothetical protein KY330_00220 [Candidatus Woesearchaeota archaeon]|nr:hypothetical protein [Candidatus Woesearchaeota archaeon]
MKRLELFLRDIERTAESTVDDYAFWVNNESKHLSDATLPEVTKVVQYYFGLNDINKKMLLGSALLNSEKNSKTKTYLDAVFRDFKRTVLFRQSAPSLTERFKKMRDPNYMPKERDNQMKYYYKVLRDYEAKDAVPLSEPEVPIIQRILDMRERIELQYSH